MRASFGCGLGVVFGGGLLLEVGVLLVIWVVCLLGVVDSGISGLLFPGLINVVWWFGVSAFGLGFCLFCLFD